jgi:hypothetical protein
MADVIGRDQANKDTKSTFKKQRSTVPATSAGPDQQGQQQQVAPRKLLLILHGKRIEDDQVRDAIKQLKDEGHEVFPNTSVVAGAASWPPCCIWLSHPILDKSWQQTIEAAFCCSTTSSAT